MQRKVVSLKTKGVDLYLTTRERHALELLGITTVSKFLRLDVRDILALRGYGQRTYAVLRESQRNLRRKLGSGAGNNNGEVTLQTDVTEVFLSRRGVKALRRLGADTVSEFLALDLSQPPALPNCGITTYGELAAKQAALVARFTPEELLRNGTVYRTGKLALQTDVGSLPLSVRAVNTLRRLGVRTLIEFLALDLSQPPEVPACGATTYRELVKQQAMLAARFTVEELLQKGAPRDLIASRATAENRRIAATSPMTPEKMRLLPFFCGVALDGVGPGELHESYRPGVGIGYLSFAKRTESVLRKKGIERLGELLLRPYNALLGKRYFGIGTLRHVQEYVAQFLADPDCNSSRSVTDYSSPEKFFLSMVTPIIADCRERTVLLKRLGMHGRPQTLAETARQYGLTRERIRQIEKAAMQKLMSWRGRAHLAPLHDLIMAIVRERGPLVSLGCICSVIQRNYGWAGAPQPKAIEKLLAAFSDLKCNHGEEVHLNLGRP